MKKRFIAVTMILGFMLVALAACGSSNQPAATTDTPATTEAPAATTDTPAATEASGGGEKVGVSMPTKSLQRWNQDGDNLKKALEEKGYVVDLQYAGDNDVPTQIANIENMITGGCKVIVIAAVNGDTLTDVLAKAKDAGIKIIAYDRLIMGSDAVTYYASFDNYKVGTFQGQYIVDTLKLDSTDGPYNVEFFTGDPADNNINFFFGGAMDVLKPYLDAGKLKVLSGQTEKLKVATEGWSNEKAQARMEDLISSNGYGPSGVKLDAVICSNDSTAQGVINALKNAGYTSANMPVITGQDADKPNVRFILDGEQAMSVFKDTRTLANATVSMVDAILKGQEPDINDTTTYDNGTGVIPSNLSEPVNMTKDNINTLFEIGYYQESDIPAGN